MLGRIKRYNPAKAYGFIEPEDSGVEVWFHRSVLTSGFVPRPGDRVEFEVAANSPTQPPDVDNRRPPATKVSPVDASSLPDGTGSWELRDTRPTGNGRSPFQVLSEPLSTELQDEVESISDKQERGTLRAELRRLKPMIGVATFDARLASANFQRLLASALARQKAYTKANTRATAAFDVYVSFRSLHRFKKSLVSCAEVRIESLIASVDPEGPRDIGMLGARIQDSTRTMFQTVGIIPRSMSLRAAQSILAAAERERQALLGDDDALQDFVARNYASVWHLHVSSLPELRRIKDDWRAAAESLCPAIAEEVSYSSVRELEVELGQQVNYLLEARKHPTCEVPDSVRTLLRAICDRVKRDATSQLEILSKPVRPIKKPQSRRDKDLFSQVLAKIEHSNFSGAETSLAQLVAGEPTSAALWEWLGYVRLRMEKKEDLAESNLKLARNYSEPDETTNWNSACAAYRLGNLPECFDLLVECTNGDAIGAAFGLALHLGKFDSVLDKISSTEDPAFLVLGMVECVNRKAYGKARQFIDQLTRKLRALQDPFQPLPYEEELDEEDVAQTLTHYLQYDQIDEGIVHFGARLTRNQRPVYALLRALGQLLESRNRISDAWSCFERECEITLNSKASTDVKADCLKRSLDFCVRRQQSVEGLDLLNRYSALLATVTKEIYAQKLAKPETSSPGVTVSSPASKTEPIPVQNSTNDAIRNANARVAELNRKYGTIGNIHHVKQAQEELYEYCDHLGTIHGSAFGLTCEIAKSIVKQFCAAAETTVAEEQKAFVEKARIGLIELDKSIAQTVPETTRHELVVIRKLKHVLGEAYVRMGLVSAPELSLLDNSLPEERSESKLFLRVRNIGRAPIDRVSISGDSESGNVKLLSGELASLGTIEPGQSRIIPIAVSKSPEATKETLFISAVYESAGLKHPNPPVHRFVLQARPFAPIPLDRYIVGSSVPANRPENFQGREPDITELLQYVEAARKGAHGVIFLDGIKQVGKSSILNFVTGRLGREFIPVRLSMMGKDLGSTADVLEMLSHDICSQALEGVTSASEIVPENSAFEKRPIETFRQSLEKVRSAKSDSRIVLIIDEVQELIRAIAEAEKRQLPLDTRVLSAWQAELEENGLIFILTGSLRYNKITRYLSHSFFRRVNRIPIGFLSDDATSDVLTAPVRNFGVTYTEEAIQLVWELTRGYASLVQRCGLSCLEQLNAGGRGIVTPTDVNDAVEGLLSDAQLFQWWWDEEILREQEMSLMRTFIQLQDETTDRGVDSAKLKQEAKELGSEVNVVINTLCDQEILEFDQGKYCIKGGLLQEWLARKFRGEESRETDILKYCVLAVDHENFFINMQKTLQNKFGVERIDTVLFKRAIHQLVENVKKYGDLVLPFAVAIWQKGFGHHRSLYEDVSTKFDTLRPPEFRKDASDAELKRRIIEQVETQVLGKRTLGTVILVTGDGGYKELVDRLKKQGRRVVVWAWECSLAESRDIAKAATRFESLDTLLVTDLASRKGA